MTEPTVDMLTNLRNNAFLELISGTVVLAISGASVLNKHIKNRNIKNRNIKKDINYSLISDMQSSVDNTSVNTYDMQSSVDNTYVNTSDMQSTFPMPSTLDLFKFSYGLGVVYGTTNIIKGAMNLSKYSMLLSDAKAPRYRMSFYVSIPFDSLVEYEPRGQSFYPPGSVFPSIIARFNISDFTDAVINYLNKFDLKIISLDLEDVDTGSSSSVNTISSNVKVDITFITKSDKNIPDKPAIIIANILKGKISINDYKLNVSADKSDILNDDIEKNK